MQKNIIPIKTDTSVYLLDINEVLEITEVVQDGVSKNCYFNIILKNDKNKKFNYSARKYNCTTTELYKEVVKIHKTIYNLILGDSVIIGEIEAVNLKK